MPSPPNSQNTILIQISQQTTSSPLMANIRFLLESNYNSNPFLQHPFHSPQLRTPPITYINAFKLNYSPDKVIRYSPKLRLKCFSISPKPKGENGIGGNGGRDDNNLKAVSGFNEVAWISIKNVINSLQITGIVLGLLFLYNHHPGCMALAASSGRMGGSSFSSSSSSSSDSYSSSSYPSSSSTKYSSSSSSSTYESPSSYSSSSSYEIPSSYSSSSSYPSAYSSWSSYQSRSSDEESTESSITGEAVGVDPAGGVVRYCWSLFIIYGLLDGLLDGLRDASACRTFGVFNPIT